MWLQVSALIYLFLVSAILQDLSPEFASMLLVVLIGGYTLVGGLGVSTLLSTLSYISCQATFYVSYFNCLVIFSLIVVFMIEIFYNPFNNSKNPFGSAAKIYEFVNCWPGLFVCCCFCCLFVCLFVCVVVVVVVVVFDQFVPGPEGNQGNSWLSFYSSGGLVFGIVNIVGNIEDKFGF